MTDYTAAANQIPDNVFADLVYDPARGDRDWADWDTHATTDAVLIRFTPGDFTLYDLLLARTADDEIAVALLNCEATAAVLPFIATREGDDASWIHPSYVAMKLRCCEATALAVAAVIARAAIAVQAIAADEQHFDSKLDRMLGGSAPGPIMRRLGTLPLPTDRS